MSQTVSNLNARSISKSTRDWLQEAKPSRVLHVFKKAVNLVAADGQLISIVWQSVGNGPFHVVLPDFDFTGSISAGSAVDLDTHSLRVGPLDISIDRCPVWDPFYPWERLQEQRFPTDSLQHLTRALTAAGIGLVKQTPGSAGSFGETGRRMADLKRDAQAFCLSVGRARIRDASYWFNQLCGRGNGLTPEGDDILIGCLYACLAWEQVIGELDWLDLIAQSASTRTTTLSAAWLVAASSGACSEVWGDFLNAFYFDDSQQIQTTITAILSQGSTSGYAALLGFETGSSIFSTLSRQRDQA